MAKGRTVRKLALFAEFMLVFRAYTELIGIGPEAVVNSLIHYLRKDRLVFQIRLNLDKVVYQLLTDCPAGHCVAFPVGYA